MMCLASCSRCLPAPGPVVPESPRLRHLEFPPVPLCMRPSPASFVPWIYQNFVAHFWSTSGALGAAMGRNSTLCLCFAQSLALFGLSVQVVAISSSKCDEVAGDTYSNWLHEVWGFLFDQPIAHPIYRSLLAGVGGKTCSPNPKTSNPIPKDQTPDFVSMASLL